MAEETEDFPELTEAQARDVVVAVTASNPGEAMLLVEVLEDAGIPAITIAGGADGFMTTMGVQDIRVPRVLAERARAVVAEARAKAESRGVEQAFDDESVENELLDAPMETDASGRVMDAGRKGGLTGIIENDLLPEKGQLTYDELCRVAELPLDERKRAVEPHLIQWLGDDADRVVLARRLAAAGFSLPEADEFVREVSAQRQREIEDRTADKRFFGWVITALGIGLIGIGISTVFIPHAYGFLGHFGMPVLATGVAVIYLSSAPRPQGLIDPKGDPQS